MLRLGSYSVTGLLLTGNESPHWIPYFFFKELTYRARKLRGGLGVFFLFFFLEYVC